MKSTTRETKAVLIEKLRIAERNSALRNLLLFIAQHPTMVEMSHWVIYKNPKTGLLTKDKMNPTCGSVGCLAGLQVALSCDGLTPDKEEARSVPEEAQKSLHLTDDEAEALFYPSEWPEDFADRLDEFDMVCYEMDYTTFPLSIPIMKKKRPYSEQKKYAQVIIDRVEHFIETGE